MKIYRLLTTTTLSLLFLLTSNNASNANSFFKVREGNYPVCVTEGKYRQFLSWSLYGVGEKPKKGCRNIEANSLVSIGECKEEAGIMVCEYTIMPPNQAPSYRGWASKVMLIEK